MPPGSLFIDKIGNTIDQLAWANDLSLQLSNNLAGFNGPEAMTTNGLIPSDNVHPGQNVRQRSFSDTKGTGRGSQVDASSKKPNNNTNSPYKSTDSLQSTSESVKPKVKRKRRRTFLKNRNNKVGVAHTKMMSGCLNDVANSLETQNDDSKTPIDTISGDISENNKQEATQIGLEQSEVPSISGSSLKSFNDGVPVNPKFKLPPVSGKLEEESENTHMSNWSSKHVIPMIEICKWDNENDES